MIKGEAQDSVIFRNQFSAYTHLNPDNKLPWWTGVRTIPGVNYESMFQSGKKIDFETSRNL
jgi:hypothetical protein